MNDTVHLQNDDFAERRENSVIFVLLSLHLLLSICYSVIEALRYGIGKYTNITGYFIVVF